MTRHLIAWLGWSLLFGCTLSPQDSVPTKWLSQEMARLLNWRWFWNGNGYPQHYVPGNVVQIAIVESPTEVAAFLGEIGVAAYFQLNNGEIVRQSIQSIPQGSNVTAVGRYVSRYDVTPGFALKEGNSPNSAEVPIRRERLTEEEKQRILKHSSAVFTLPTLGPPEYIASRQPPQQLTDFVSTVHARVDDFYVPSCGSGEVLIPYFSLNDPAVYVYVYLGTCGKGIIGFVNDGNGGWASGQFSPAKAPNDWSNTIKRIRENTAAAISLGSGSPSKHK